MSAHPSNFWLLGRSGTESQMRMRHHLQHRTYDLALSKQGISLGALDLTAPVNRDWIFRHGERHKALRQITGGNAPTCDLSSLDWTDDESVRAWMHYHAVLHQQISQYLKVPS
jgi:hypothetical protein